MENSQAQRGSARKARWEGSQVWQRTKTAADVPRGPEPKAHLHRAPLLLGLPVLLPFTNDLNPICVVRSRGDSDEMTGVMGTRALESAPCSRLGSNPLQRSVVLREYLSFWGSDPRL